MEEGKRILEIKDQEVGSEYNTALGKVIDIRKGRRSQYGDTYLDDEDYFLLAQIENKLKRLKLQFDGFKLSPDKEKIKTALDSAKDLCNYTIFFIAKNDK